VSHYLPTRALRSADTQLLTVPRSRLVLLTDIAVPTEWNNLPSTVRTANSVRVFHSRLRAYLASVYCTPPDLMGEIYVIRGLNRQGRRKALSASPVVSGTETQPQTDFL